ncbi:MAG: DNA polymerase-3 subunit delta' [Rickettsiales bacterium]|jgi:DNA polymerase-3 subunit delta'
MNYELRGFDKYHKKLLKNFHDNKLHHGLLLAGNKGIGKASFVLSLTKEILLSSSINKIEDSQKIESNCHPDLLIIKKLDKKRDISVDAMREINKFLSLTSAISKHRIIIIDAIDDLNRSSSNAILKNLEEPAKNVFLFLINHNQSRVLDTIKSRCYLIKFSNPSHSDFEEILKERIDGIDKEEIQILAKISDYSIGSALQMHECSAIDLYERIKELILENNAKDTASLAKTISTDEELWDIFEKLIIFYFYNLISSLEVGDIRSNKIFTTLDKVNNIFSATKNLNLDKSQSIVNIINMLIIANHKL